MKTIKINKKINLNRFERFFFGDPHYHLDEDEGLMN
jgi:hypothetical protein